MIDIDGSLNYHATALQLREQRAQILAENLANIDTPHYKARDVDFRDAMRQVNHAPTEVGGSSIKRSLMRTHTEHLDIAGSGQAEPMYRVPTQPSLDGNTVEETVEKAKFGQNALEYQGSLRFLNTKIRSLMTAIRGE
jgi:flagellar basal-body rod protein FlgB